MLDSRPCSSQGQALRGNGEVGACHTMQWTYRLRGTIIPRLVALPQQRGAEVRVGGSYMNPLDSIPGTIVAGIVLSFLLAYLAKVLIGG